LFRDRVSYSRDYKKRLATARKAGAEAVRSVAAEFSDMINVEAGIVVDLFLSFRAVKAFQEMVDLCERMSRTMQNTRLVQEQLAFALNRLGRSEDAEQILKQTIEKYGQSSETNGLLGRVYKDRWENALKAGRGMEARGFLKRAIEAYRAGFETDW